MPEIRIERFTPEMTAESARMLARAFVDNPLHVAAFGPEQLARSEAFFQIGLSVMKGSKFVAVDGPRIVGLVHWASSPDCQLPVVQTLTLAPAMIRGFGVGSAWRVARWLSFWSKSDPATPHVHLGPIGVDPDVQGQGVGQLLMERYCDQLDRLGQVGYLETDRRENVAFYARFRFEVIAEIPVLGVPNYLMRREPAGGGRIRVPADAWSGP